MVTSTVLTCRPATNGSKPNVRWRITVGPGGNGLVTVVLPVATDWNTQGDICTADERKLSNRSDLTVSGPDG